MFSLIPMGCIAVHIGFAAGCCRAGTWITYSRDYCTLSLQQHCRSNFKLGLSFSIRLILRGLRLNSRKKGVQEKRGQVLRSPSVST